MFEEDPTKDPKFKIKAWMPQIEVLSHPAMRACLTHCGWGGILECIGAGVPMVTFPHLGDQNSNSDLVVSQGVAVELHNKPKANQFDLLEGLTYREPAFDHTKVCKVFQTILEDSKYKMNMAKLQSLARLQKGREQVVQIVEQTYHTGGNNHLFDISLKKKMQGQSCCRGTLFMCFLYAIVVLAAVFITLYYTESD